MKTKPSTKWTVQSISEHVWDIQTVPDVKVKDNTRSTANRFVCFEFDFATQWIFFKNNAKRTTTNLFCQFYSIWIGSKARAQKQISTLTSTICTLRSLPNGTFVHIICLGGFLEKASTNYNQRINISYCEKYQSSKHIFLQVFSQLFMSGI